MYKAMALITAVPILMTAPAIIMMLQNRSIGELPQDSHVPLPPRCEPLLSDCLTPTAQLRK
jgi:hypothetical protein